MALVAFLDKFFDIVFDIVPKNLFEIFCINKSLP